MAFNYNAAKQAGFNDAQIGEYMRLKGVSAPQKKSVAGFAGNVVKSGARAVGDLGSALVNTVNPNLEKNTLWNVGKLGVGAAQLLIPGEQGLEKNARAVGSFYKDRYGSMDAIKNTLYNDPVGAGLDVAAVVSGAGGALKGAGTVSKIPGIVKAGTTLTKASSFIDPFSLASKGAGAAGRATISTSGKVGQRLRGMAENLPTRGLGNPALQAKAASKAGQSTNDFMRKYDWYDRSSETMGAIKKNIQQQYDDKALRSGTSVPTGQIVKQIDAQINKLRQGVNGVVSDSDMKAIEELTRRRQQMLQAVGGQFKDGVQVSSPIRSKTRDLTRYRREVIDKDIPQSTYNLDAQAGGTVRGTKTMRDFLRKTINSTDPQLERLGLDIGQAKSLGKVAEGYESRGANRQLFNFTKLGSAGIGGFLAGAPGIVGGFAVEQMVNSPGFLRFTSQVLDKLTQKFPAGSPLATKTRPQIYKEILEVAKREGSTDPERLAQALADRYMREPAYKEIIDDMAGQTAREYDGTLMAAPLKSTGRTTEKIVRDSKFSQRGESARNVNDISRNTIIIPDFRQADRVARNLTNKNSNILYEPAKKNYFKNPTSAGYQGINTNLKTAEGMAEIQINVPEMIVAKMPAKDALRALGEKKFQQIAKEGITPGLGHSLYEKQRVIMEKAQELLAQRSKTPRQFTEIDGVFYTTEEASQLSALNQQSKALYEKAMALHKQNRSGILPTAQAYGLTKYNTKNAFSSAARAGRMNRTE